MQLKKYTLMLILFFPGFVQGQSNPNFIPYSNKISVTVQKEHIPFSIGANHDIPSFAVAFSLRKAKLATSGSDSKLDCLKLMGQILTSDDYLDGQLTTTFGPVYYADANWLSGQPAPAESQGWKCLQVLQIKNTKPNAVRQGTYTSYLVRTQYPASTFSHFDAMLQTLVYLTDVNPNNPHTRFFGDRLILGVYSNIDGDPCPKVGDNWACEFQFHVLDPIPGVD